MAQLKTGSTVGGKAIATTDQIPAPVQVVDNLTTNDATKALSAKQGMELFQSVSNGKNLIATAITDIGIPTSSSDTFQKMVDNIINFGIPADKSNAPGNKFLLGGDIGAGYFGIVPSTQLITGDALASLVGISDGTSQFSDEGWLKFAYQGKIQFIAKKPIRSAIKWNSISAANCVTGARTVIIGGLTYKVRLMKGSRVTTPNVESTPADIHYSEWNKLILPITINAKTKNWYPDVSKFVESDVKYWGIDFTEQDLHTAYSNGSGTYTLCQETTSKGSSYTLIRSNVFGIAGAESVMKSLAVGNYGWRPVLELV